eukprot:Gb_11158 [translate_table: standard]
MAFHNNKYRVFLSFRGKDVRKSLVDHLYQSLVAAGISTFLDSEELEKGDDIKSSLEKAIVESEIYIPIFSTNYAESSWCLKELSLMCSHISTSKSPHKMIPLFYKVEPSHVRYPDGEKSPYAKYFRDHSKKARHNTDTIDQWKDALEKASSLSGWSLEDASGFEGKLVKHVLMDTLEKLNNGSLEVAKQPVGLKERMDKLKDLLKCPKDNSVRTEGIWGMGGIGKTTLSKAVCNDIKSMFDAFCFLSDVREKANESKKGLTELQEQIMKDLLKIELKEKINSVDEVKVKMKEHLGSIRALLILDDVDNRKQLEALHVDGCLGGGSRVIITTRDKHILNLAHADEIYEAEELEHNQALELFSWHAFLRVCPDEGYEDLSKRVVKACKGLPLSLEVMGAHLYDKRDDTTFWDEAVIRIENLVDKDLYETLKISFNSLLEEERQIFLDIACFFVGEDKELAISHWKASDCKNPHTAITNLSLKSLIRVSKFGYFWMHDHLRDLGREIVEEESREDPCKRIRLWHSNDVRRVLSKHKEISNVRGFKCCGFENVVPMESLTPMKNTRLLWLKNVQIVGQNKTRFLPKLKCLRLWNRCDVLEFPTLLEGLLLENIRVLSKLQRISFNMSQMNELKVLRVSDWKSLTELPGLGSRESLTKLVLRSCRELAELPPLPRGLVEARIEGCSRLKTISFDMSQMNELKVLHVSYCKSLTELPELGFLKSLTELELRNCPKLREMPPLPKGLIQTCIKWCSRLKTISFDMSQMNALKVLHVSYCESLTELPGLCSLESLTKLKLNSCCELAELPPLPRGLVQARIKWCSQLKTILCDMSQMNELEVLHVSHCPNVTEIRGLGSLQSLIELELRNCWEIAELPPLPRGLVQARIKWCSRLKTMSFDMSQMNELKVLHVSDWVSLTGLPMLGSLKSLTELELRRCRWLAELPPLPRGLVQARIEGCSRLKTISFDMSQMNELKVLHVSQCESITELPNLGSLESLKKLVLRSCEELAELPALPRGLVQALIERCSQLKTISFDMSQMNELKVLHVSHSESLTELPGLGSLKSLTELELTNCPKLSKMPHLPRGLVQTRIEWCSQLKTILFDMSQMNELKVFYVSNCESLTELRGFGSLKFLTEVELSSCGELAELPPLPEALVQARIEECSRLKTISFDMSQVNELKVLHVSHCENLTELRGLGSLKSLTELELRNCPKLEELPPLPRGLVQARIQRCSRLKTISFDMSQMNELKVLHVSSCQSFMEVPGLGSLKSLTELELRSCTELAEMPPLPRGLVQACIEGCSRLKTISFDMPQTNELKVLHVSSCESLRELPGLGSLKSLTEVELMDCMELAELPPLPRGVIQDRIRGCSRLKDKRKFHRCFNIWV